VHDLLNVFQVTGLADDRDFMKASPARKGDVFEFFAEIRAGSALGGAGRWSEPGSGGGWSGRAPAPAEGAAPGGSAAGVTADPTGPGQRGLIRSSSTSKTSVAPGGITRPAPRSP
jgi:hypothetical protein